eukprot:GFUD01133936.1.p1 GENE.GFUD01133936.1~~GFUD01133936.1.p1  ORF type:complete len:146 (-),score=40.14 GFUD01133936.1:121-558(-)
MPVPQLDTNDKLSMCEERNDTTPADFNGVVCDVLGDIFDVPTVSGDDLAIPDETEMAEVKWRRQESDPHLTTNFEACPDKEVYAVIFQLEAEMAEVQLRDHEVLQLIITNCEGLQCLRTPLLYVPRMFQLDLQHPSTSPWMMQVL